jgi:hypothetical protein
MPPLSVIAKSAAMKQSRGAREAGLLRCFAPANDNIYFKNLCRPGRFSAAALPGQPGIDVNAESFCPKSKRIENNIPAILNFTANDRTL